MIVQLPEFFGVHTQLTRHLHLGMAQPKFQARFNPGPQLLGNEEFMFCGHTDFIRVCGSSIRPRNDYCRPGNGVCRPRPGPRVAGGPDSKETARG